jgi:hypothetical protein
MAFELVRAGRTIKILYKPIEDMKRVFYKLSSKTFITSSWGYKTNNQTIDKAVESGGHGG